MKKNILLLFVLQFLFAPVMLYSQYETPSEPVRPTLKAAADLRKARALEAEGKLNEALAEYEKLLARKDLSRQTQEKIASRYEAINRKLVFEHQEGQTAEHITEYTVKPGDSLYVIARKHNTTVGMIKQMNEIKKDIIHPGMKLKIVTAPLSIRVDKSENMLLLYIKDKLIKHYRVATGKDNNTPVGTFKIVNKLVDPTWYHEGKVVPPNDPENILGTRWLGFDKAGYGIHGTTQPESIGTQASLGCIRMHNKEVEELYELVPTGTEVIISE